MYIAIECSNISLNDGRIDAATLNGNCLIAIPIGDDIEVQEFTLSIGWYLENLRVKGKYGKVSVFHF